MSNKNKNLKKIKRCIWSTVKNEKSPWKNRSLNFLSLFSIVLCIHFCFSTQFIFITFYFYLTMLSKCQVKDCALLLCIHKIYHNFYHVLDLLMMIISKTSICCVLTMCQAYIVIYVYYLFLLQWLLDLVNVLFSRWGNWSIVGGTISCPRIYIVCKEWIQIPELNF